MILSKISVQGIESEGNRKFYLITLAAGYDSWFFYR